MNRRDDPWAALRDPADAAGPDDLFATWSEPETSSPAAPRTGDLIAVVGACGGGGASTVAGGLALALKEQEGGARLVDLDFAWGDLHGGWGVPRDRTIHDLSAVRDELTPEQVEMVLCHHPSGVRLALSPGSAEAAGGWDVDAISRLLSGTAAGAPTVVDVGRVDPSLMLAACTSASRCLVVAPRTIRGARGVGGVLDMLGSGVEVVVNLSGRDADISLRSFRRLVGCPVRCELPRSPLEAEWIGSGRRPRGRRRPLRDAIDALTRRAGE